MAALIHALMDARASAPGHPGAAVAMSGKRRTIVYGLLVALVASAIYGNTLSNGFALDDVPLIVQNTRVHDAADPATILLTPYWPEFGGRAGLYRPLPVLGWALQWAAGGGQPWLFHLVSILLYTTLSVLVFALLRSFVTGGAALFGTLLFAVHPVHTEVVANVVGQAELLAACAVLTACLLHVRRAVAPQRNAWLPYTFVMTVLFAVGLLAKESAIVLPGLLVAVDAARGVLGSRSLAPAALTGGASTGGRASGATIARLAYVRGIAPLIIAFAVVATAWFALRIRVIGSLTGSQAAPTLPLLEDAGPRLLVALAAWPQYLRLLLFPVELSADYAPDVFVPPAGVDAAVLLGAALLITTLALAFMTLSRPRVGLPAAWFLIAVLPVSNLVFPIGVLLAERLLFLPSVALAFAAGFAAARAPRTLDARRLRLAAVAAAILLGAGGIRTFVRNPDWKDTDAFWRALLRDHPESYKAQRTLAQVMEQRGDHAGARRYTELAWTTWPHDAELATELALLRMRDGEFDDVVVLLEAARSGTTSRRTPIVLARAYLANGRWTDALAVLSQLDTAGTDRAGIVALQAQAEEGLGRREAALVSWQTVTGLPDGQGWTWWTLLARARARIGDVKGAQDALERARSLAPPQRFRLIDAMAGAVEKGCFAVDTSSGTVCRDPIAGWVLVTRNDALDSNRAGRSHVEAADRTSPAPARIGGSR